MKVVILAGGLGTRLSEETHLRPKPMVEIGGKPILWHIMKFYSHFGLNEFIICAGYKSNVIKDYFSNYFLYNSDITFDLSNNEIEIHSNKSENWKVTVVDTGLATMTGGRLLRVKDYINSDFCFTYGDGLSNVDINSLIKFHKSKKCIATLTAVQTPERFGNLHFGNSDKIVNFSEKPEAHDNWINGGFFVLSKDIFDYIDGDETVFEKNTLEKLSTEENLFALKHNGFWHAMDKLSDKVYLEKLWSESPPWKLWKN